MGMIKYGVIVADPPWAYKVGKSTGKSGVADKQYDTMGDADICALQVDGVPVSDLAADDSVLLMWATWPKLVEALDVVKAWGFDYVTGLPWIKITGTPQTDLWGDLTIRPSYGVGFWFRGATEPILVGRRGNAKAPREEGMVGLLCDRMQHSRKPENIHHIAETMPGPYLELFGRRQRDGWRVWGNEV